jgi:hypothetical protein
MCASKARMDISLAYSVLALPTFANFGLRVYGQPRHTWGHSRSMPVLLSGHSALKLTGPRYGHCCSGSRHQASWQLPGIHLRRHWFSMMGTVLPFEIITYAI